MALKINYLIFHVPELTLLSVVRHIARYSCFDVSKATVDHITWIMFAISGHLDGTISVRLSNVYRRRLCYEVGGGWILFYNKPHYSYFKPYDLKMILMPALSIRLHMGRCT